MTKAMPQISLRIILQEELPALAGMHRQIWQKAYANIFPEEKLQNLREEDFLASWQERTAEGCWSINWVFREGEKAGFIMYGEAQDKVMEIKSFYFLPAYWGMGVADAAMQELLERFKAVGSRKIILWVLKGNKRARQFYRRHGFSPTSKMQSRERLGFTITEVQMVHELSS